MGKFGRWTKEEGKASYVMLIVFFIVLWVAGGASRADVLGQPVVRFFAWALLAIALFVLPRSDWRPNWQAVRVPAILLGLAALLPLLQIIPLPPSLWQSLPGREVFAPLAALLGTEEVWRPLSISPAGTQNALASLIVPVTALFLAANLTREQHWSMAKVLLGLAAAGALIGLLQFSGLRFNNPFLNAAPGSVSGHLANRNHFGLFLAMGCFLAMLWSLRLAKTRLFSWLGFGLILIFVLVILATGSRASLGLGFAALVLAAAAFRFEIKNGLRRLSARMRLVTLGVFGGASVLLIWLTIASGRAASVERALGGNLGGEARAQLWQVTTAMAERFAPFGTGLGTFDQAFRMSEPDTMLRPQYYNQAHNDWLQIVLEAGLFGAVLLIAAVIWFALRALAAWREASAQNRMGEAARQRVVLAQTGSVIIALVMAASVTDYPGRTPMIMAMVALASVWLSLKPQAQR